LHLILQGEIGSWQQLEQVRQIGGKLVSQISFD
jgi:DNA uptake protein ComE-like DNA-binding protein